MLLQMWMPLRQRKSGVRVRERTLCSCVEWEFELVYLSYRSGSRVGISKEITAHVQGRKRCRMAILFILWLISKLMDATY